MANSPTTKSNRQIRRRNRRRALLATGHVDETALTVALSWAESLWARSLGAGAARTRAANVAELLVHYTQHRSMQRLWRVEKQTASALAWTDGHLAGIDGWSSTWRSVIDHTRTNSSYCY